MRIGNVSLELKWMGEKKQLFVQASLLSSVRDMYESVEMRVLK